jgi:hypothetical protein
MKRMFLVSALCVAFVTVMPVIAQDAEGGSPYYYVNVPIERIYPYRKGYVVDYQSAATGIGFARVFIPLEWFSDAGRKEDGAPKGQITLMGPGKSWPYLSVYYNKDGEFSHVHLYVRRERSHETWGGIPLGVNIDSNFEDVSDIKLTL